MPISDKKRAYGEKLMKLMTTSRAILIVGADNVGSAQLAKVRIALRGEATIMMGKNTTVRRVLKNYLADNPDSPLAGILPLVVGNIGFIFTDGDVAKVRETVLAHRVPAPARVGSVSPDDVFVEPGPTGCDPGQTAWFQALNIPTKIQRGLIDIIARVFLIKKGEKVSDSAAALLNKLNIKPFSYALKTLTVYDDGEIFDADILDITEEILLSKLMSGIRVVAAAGLQLGLPSRATITHSINTAYKAVLAVAIGTDYKFEAAKAFEEFLANPGAFAPAATTAAADTAEVAEEEEEEEEEEESVGGAADMFGGSDDDSSS